jgi:hypothetical protein
MASIVADLGVVYNSSATTPTSSPSLLYTAVSNYLVEVIATNLAITDGVIYIFVKHASDTVGTQWAYIVYNLPLPSQNAYESTKIAVKQGDSVYVAGSASISFHAQGMAQIS